MNMHSLQHSQFLAPGVRAAASTDFIHIAISQGC